MLEEFPVGCFVTFIGTGFTFCVGPDESPGDEIRHVKNGDTLAVVGHALASSRGEKEKVPYLILSIPGIRWSFQGSDVDTFFIRGIGMMPAKWFKPVGSRVTAN